MTLSSGQESERGDLSDNTEQVRTYGLHMPEGWENRICTGEGCDYCRWGLGEPLQVVALAPIREALLPIAQEDINLSEDDLDPMAMLHEWQGRVDALLRPLSHTKATP